MAEWCVIKWPICETSCGQARLLYSLSQHNTANSILNIKAIRICFRTQVGLSYELIHLKVSLFLHFRAPD